eukprot:scaffold25790_cov59-Phaeocystis_antarctica.AAC.1
MRHRAVNGYNTRSGSLCPSSDPGVVRGARARGCGPASGVWGSWESKPRFAADVLIAPSTD